MHSLNHSAYARSVVAERVAAAAKARRAPRSLGPPPSRGKAAFVAKRLHVRPARRAGT